MSQSNPTEFETTKYAESYVLYGNQSKAFRAAFPETKASNKVINQKASRLHTLGNIQARIDELHKSINRKAYNEAISTSKQAIYELEVIRSAAMNPDNGSKPQLSAAVSAVMGKAKIAGLLTEKAIVKDTSEIYDDIFRAIEEAEQNNC